MNAIALAVVLAAGPLDERGARRELASGLGAASAPVAGEVHLLLRAYAADVEVVTAPEPRLSVSVEGRRAVRVVLWSAGGDRIEVEFGGKRQLHEGKLHVEVPRGAAVDVKAVSGRVSVALAGGLARVRSMSGPVQVAGAGEADVETVDGAVEVADVTGPVRVHTTAGAVLVSSPLAATRLTVETASGEVRFRGPCGRGCHVDVDSVTGDVRFALDASSAFAASVISSSGKVRDLLPVGFQARPRPGEAAWVEGRYGAGEGLIECETFSGDVTFAGR